MSDCQICGPGFVGRCTHRPQPGSAWDRHLKEDRPAKAVNDLKAIRARAEGPVTILTSAIMRDHDDIRHLLALLDECREVLRSIGDGEFSRNGGCDVCGALAEQAHQPDCKLAALLAKLGGPDGQ